MTAINDLQAGKVGEYLVCADLILAGYIAFPSEQGLPFDVVVDVGPRLVKVQVKTTRALRAIPQRGTDHSGYIFHVKRMGKNGTKRHDLGTADIFALVSLDNREIGYLATRDVRETMIFRSPSLRGSYQDEALAPRTATILRLRSEGLSYSQIAERTGTDTAFAHRVCTGQSGKMRNGKYLADFTFSDALSKLGAINDRDQAR